jgi:hypothetical protein
MANIIGTELDDPNLTGTAAADTISGLGGRDHLYGGAGNDTLLGGAGDDAMHGDAGADIMFGGAGNDDYYVDDVNDVVSETTAPGVDDGGTDRVYSTVSYTLSSFLERLVLLESAVAISATGNAQVNSIVGNSNANIISGGGGKDTLTGGLGADTFALGPANAANTVTITDFAAEDKFGITASDYGLSQGSGLVDNGSGALVLDPTWFATVTGTQGTVAGHGQFLYNTTTGSLMWDADGSGAVTGIALAKLQTGAVVTAGNFAISGATSTPVVGDISITDVTIAEGNSGTKTATFTVSHTGTAAFSVDYATANGSATAGPDYVATSNTLNFVAGSGAAQSQTVSVTINGDATVEPDETFFVNLLSATNGGTIVKSQGIGTITNDDTVGNISISDVTIAEGNAGTSIATFTVTRTGGTAAFDVNYATADGTATTANSDYSALQVTTLNFAAGDLTKTISVTINGDTTVESDETFFVNLLSATNGGTIVKSQGIGTITDDDTVAAVVGDISITDVTIAEGDSGTKTATFTVSHTGTAAFSVDYATADGTATAGPDYVATSNTLNFAAGSGAAQSQTVSVTISGDTTVEPNETFFVSLLNATGGGTIVKSQGIGTVTNDDAVGNISIGDVTIAEGNAGTSIATFTVSRTGGNAAFDLTYATADGTATAGSDYVAQPTGTVSFAAGDLTKTISVTINGDTTVEPDETFFVNLLSATGGGTLLKSQGVGAIANDDTAGGVGNISINDVTITEGNSGTKVATFTVSHTGSAAFSVNYATANSTATAGTSGDYLAASGTLNFAAGTSTLTVSVTIRGDTIYEPNETFFVNLTGATNGGTITKTAGLGTIANDDTAPVGPAVVAVHDMSAIASEIGSWDPSGLAYDAATGTLYLVDSEVDEVTPRGTANMWALNLDGTLKPNGAISLYGYTTEPTGIAFDSATGKMYVSDDDTFKVYVTNVANPSVKLAEFATKPLGGDDPEEVTFNPVNGHLYIANGSDIGHTKIIETDSSGTQVIRNIPVPAVIKDPEAVVYDVAHDVFFVGIENGKDIWMVDHNGNILNDINIFANYRNPVNNGSVNLKGLTLAPSSDPNDDPSVLSLYAADFGISHINDGRLFEISNPFTWNHPAPVILTNNLTTAQNLDGSMTVSGVQVTDSDAFASSGTFSLTATTGAAASGTSITPTTSSGSLTGINSVFATGVTYHPGVTPPSTDKVTVTVADAFGATDTMNFVFNEAGTGPNISLQGTPGKDVIFATNSQDVLTGGAAQDQFVFAPTSAGPSVQHTITDFVAGLDKIDVRQFSNISASALPTETQQGGNTLVTLDSHDTLLLTNVNATNLHASDFILHA